MQRLCNKSSWGFLIFSLCWTVLERRWLNWIIFFGGCSLKGIVLYRQVPLLFRPPHTPFVSVKVAETPPYNTIKQNKHKAQRLWRSVAGLLYEAALLLVKVYLINWQPSVHVPGLTVIVIVQKKGSIIIALHICLSATTTHKLSPCR